MSKPSHRAAAGINKRARQHYPHTRPLTETPAVTVPDTDKTDADTAAPKPDSGWSDHKSDLNWPIETDDPWIVGLAIAALFVMVVGLLTVIGGLGFGLWHLGAAIFHSFH